MRDTGARVYGVGKIHDIFAGCDIDESAPTKSNTEGISQTERLLREVEDGVVFTNLVETDMLWGHRNDPVNFHRCLQDFDRRLPDLLEALQTGDLFVLTSDHGCDPTTPSTDHSRGARAPPRVRRRPQRRRPAPRGGSSRTSARRSTRGSEGRPRHGRTGPADRGSVRVDDARAQAVIRPAELIQRKRDGGEIAADELAELVLAYARGDVPDYQMAAFLMAVYFRGLSAAETFALTDAMIRSGESIDLRSELGRKVVDKHSTGGVGDKTSLAVGPVVAACGVPLGKMSGRGLGHTGGTLDKLESIPGFRVELSHEEFVAQLREIGLAIVGQTASLVPADKALYALRDVTAHRRPGLADRGEHHVQEARGGRRGDRARRQGR